MKYLYIISMVLLFSGCYQMGFSPVDQEPKQIDTKETNQNKIKSSDQPSFVDIDGSLIDIDELFLEKSSKDKKVIEVFRSDVLEKSEHDYLKSVQFYQDGNLEYSRLLFDSFLNNMEYLYEDSKVSDSVMIADFSEEFFRNNNEIEVDFFKLYRLLYKEMEDVAEKDSISELKIENSISRVVQNDQEFIFTKKKVALFLKTLGWQKQIPQKFIKLVSRSIIVYLEDKVSLQEISIRYSRYNSFLSKAFVDESLPEELKFIPAVMTSYYDNKRNGSIWRLPRIKEYIKIRKDLVASSAVVIRKIKHASKKNKIFNIIGTLVENRTYDSSELNTGKLEFGSKFADFVAISIILMNPNKYGLKESLDESDKNYFKSYTAYIKNPRGYFKARKKTKSKPVSRRKSKYIRLKYKVRKGDNLAKIASLFRCSIKDIKRWNPRSTRKKYLHRGSYLYFRGYKFTSYKARRGDSIGKICKKFSMQHSQFMKVNNLASKRIYRGRTYYVYK